MTLATAFPVRLDAPLSRIDPRWKLAALAAAGAATAALHTLGPALTALSGSVILVGLARLPPRWYLARLGSLVLALALFLALLPFGAHGDEAWEVGPLEMSPRGLTLALVLLTKAAALLSLVLAGATTAPADVQFKALHALRVPGAIVQTLALTVRYLALLREEFATIRMALRVRGYRQRATPASLRTVGHVAGMLLVRASDRAERVGQALRCRGFEGRLRSLTVFRTRPVDVVFFALVLGAAAGVLAWDMIAR